MLIITNNTDDTSKIGKKIAAGLKGGEVFCLYGELGAGKSVFTRALINYFLPGIRVLSPTFIIVRQYETGKIKIKTIYHLDLYRLTNTGEFQDLGLESRREIIRAMRKAATFGLPLFLLPFFNFIKFQEFDKLYKV